MSSYCVWAVVHEYKKDELADNLDDEKWIFKSVIRVKAQRKHNKSKLSADHFSKPCGPQMRLLSNRYPTYNPNRSQFTIRPGNCYPCGKAGHWRNKCPGSSQQ